MRTLEIQKGQEMLQKQKSFSTSSFYRPAFPPKMTVKNNNQIGLKVEHQQRQTQQQIQKIRLGINLKIEYIEKRQNQTVQDSRKNFEQIVEFQKNLIQKTKNIQRNDRTKQWAIEMEKTIQSIISNNKQSNKKSFDKCVNEWKKYQTKSNDFENKIREQKKQRQKQWEELIDNIGETIVQAQQLIQQQKSSMQLKLSEIEGKVLDIEQHAMLTLQQQKNKRKQQHEYLTKLIERIMDRLLH